MKYLITLAICLAATTASAQTCTGENQIVVPKIEAAKAAFLAGNYKNFARLLEDDISDVRAEFDDLFGPLERAVDGGYSACSTVLQRHEDPGFYQDIAAFEHLSFDAPIYLYIEGVRIGDGFRFTQFVYGDVPSDLFDNLR